MKSRTLLLPILFLVITFLLSSCLTCETKEYTFKFTGKNSGNLTIKYNNIMSKNDSKTLSNLEALNEDYEVLINKYIKGDEVEKAYPNAKIVSKRIFEENGKLCGEIVFEFVSIDQVLLFQINEKSPYMFQSFDSYSETITSTNGNVGPNYFNVVYWDSKMNTLMLKTSVDTPDATTTSLLAKWKGK